MPNRQSLNIPRLLLLLRTAALLLTVVLMAGQISAAENREPNFSQILETQTRATIRTVAEYVTSHPQAVDREQAYRWLFEAVVEHGLETELSDLAAEYLEQASEEQISRPQAERVYGIGLVKAGKLKEGMVEFQKHLETAELRNPNHTVAFGMSLTAQLQIQGDVAAAREIYDAMLQRFFLNRLARRLFETRLSHLELAGKPAPEIGTSDTEGQAVKVSDYKGKVLLIDFWSVNCGPCLAQFPALKRLYEDYHGQGFEMVGITLDEDREVVDEFQKELKLPWRLSLSGTDQDETLQRYHVTSIPSVYLLDQNGEIVAVDLSGDDLRSAVEKLLGAEK